MKRCISVVLVLSMVVSLFVTMPITVDAATGDDIVTEARKWLGTSYGHSKGDGGPGTSVDCSGLVLQVYKKFGYDLPWFVGDPTKETNYNQATCGTAVDNYITQGNYSNLKKGDLIIFHGHSGDAWHIGIYSGNGYVINAQNTGGVVEAVLNRYWGNYAVGVRRILTDEIHEHGFWIEYEDAHPHREYRRCSCGHTEYTGYIPNGYALKNETAHPHREYKKCYNCNYTEYTGKTVTVNTCSQCATPGKPSLLNMMQIYGVNTEITLSWEETVNTTHYNVYFHKTNEDGEYEAYQHYHYANSGNLYSLPVGEYRVQVQSTNSNAWTEDGSTWRYTDSDWYYFEVTDQKPVAEISLTNGIIGGYAFELKTILNFEFEVENATYWYFIVEKDGERIHVELSSGEYEKLYRFDEEGIYNVQIQAANDNGWTIDSRIVSIAGESGSCGNNLTWTFDKENGVLAIRGIGNMHDYNYLGDSYPCAPWLAYKNEITEIIIEDGVTSIGNDAFKQCKNLTEITIPESIKHIGGHAFQHCESIENIVIPKGVTSISGATFNACYNLKSITIPNTVKDIFAYAFGTCTSLTDIYYEGTRADWNEITIDEYNDCLTNATIHRNDFCGENMSWKAYIRTNGGTYLVIEGTGDMYDFNMYAPGLAPWRIYNDRDNVIISSGVTSIGDYAFCRLNIGNIEMASTVTQIGEGAFYASTLPRIWLPKNLTLIEKDAFYGCGALTDVYYEGSQEEWNKITIESGNECLINAKIHFEGESPDTYLPGDINGDGEVTTKDVTTLRRYIAGGYDVTVIDKVLDVNRDNTITTKDVTTLRRFIAGGYGVELE